MSSSATNTEAICPSLSAGIQPRTAYFDILRIIAALAVVMIHVSVYPWKAEAVTTMNWAAANFYDSLARFSVPVFVMISGALFLSRERSVKQLYQKSILRIAIAFAFWSVFYALAVYLYEAVTEPQNQGNWQELLADMIRGHYHLWFLPMIVGLYMVTPFLRKILESESLTKYLLTLSFVLGIIVPQFLAILPLFFPELGSAVSNLWKNFNLSAGYVSYFVMGYILHRAKLSPKTERLIYLLGGAGLFATFVLTAVVSVWKGTPKSLFYENLTLNVFLYSIAIFVWLGRHFLRIKSERLSKFVQGVSKCSFGACLVHVMVLKLWYVALGGHLSPWIEIPLFTVAVFALSILISWVIGKIPQVGKYIV